MDRRSVIVPPEMTNGSSNGSASSNSSARAMRIRGGHEIQEMEAPTAPLELPRRLTLQHDGDQTVARMEDQGVQRTLRARAIGCGILLERQLKECMELHRRTATQRVVDDHPARIDVPGPCKRRSVGWAVRRSVQHPQ